MADENNERTNNNNNNTNTYSATRTIEYDFKYETDQATFERFIREHQILTMMKKRQKNHRNNKNRNNNNSNNATTIVVADNDTDNQSSSSSSDDDDSDSDDDDEIPSAAGATLSTARLTRQSCFMKHLQRIKDRHFYSEDELNGDDDDDDDDHDEQGRNSNNNNNHPNTSSSSSSSSSSRMFIIEVPLDELVVWDNVKGKDVADRAIANCIRYHQLFCTAFDNVIESIQPSSSSSSNHRSNHQNVPIVRDTVDILHQQRLAVMEQNRQSAANTANSNNNINGGGNNNNIYNAMGNMDADAQNEIQTTMNQQQQYANGATEEFPPVLMRRYELRILPYKRRGSLPPFLHQHLVAPSSSGYSGSTSNSMDVSKFVSSVGPIPLSLRRIHSTAVGKLLTLTGMVVRSSDVKPCCQVATYSCDNCGSEIYQVLSLHHREFMPAKICPSNTCNGGRNNNNNNNPGGGGGGGNNKRSTLYLQTRGSKLIKFQEIKLQELPNHVPMGHIPRSLTVLCRGELTRLASPGDVVTIDGVYLTQRIAESGYRAMKAGLIATTYVEVQNMIVHKKSFDDPSSSPPSATTEQHSSEGTTTSTTTPVSNEEDGHVLDQAIVDVATSTDPVGILAASLAPEIFGHEDIKRSLLLQLVGGCTRVLPDGMRIRGDINICLMGDPGVAKSQLLKHVSSIAPRGVYTTGKGSSGVGLTAAVTKDSTTGDMALEGGALVLADRGICCIDEFDKMEESDRTAIHEVMEQQTVSIAKAGIIATLNARASVLAAANPLYGRYNKNKSISDNINLPNSLLSRFDLLYLILDVPHPHKDLALAKHVTQVHQNHQNSEKRKEQQQQQQSTTTTENDSGGTEDQDDENNENDPTHIGTKNQQTTTTSSNNNTGLFANYKPVSARVLREYVCRARQYQPFLTPEVAPYVVEAYVSLRMQHKNGHDGSNYNSNNRPSRYNNNNNSSTSNDQTVMTARQLLSILRVSQALARLRFSDYVAREDVDEAIRLTHMSKASLQGNTVEDEQYGSGGGTSTGTSMDPSNPTTMDNRNYDSRKRQRKEDYISSIFNRLRDHATTTTASHHGSRSTTTTDGTSTTNNSTDIGLPLTTCSSLIVGRGYTQEQLDECLKEYETIHVIHFNETRTFVYF